MKHNKAPREEFSGNALLIRKKQHFPKATQAELAHFTGSSKPTIQRKLKRLRESGDLEEKLILTANNKYFPLRVMITVDVNPQTLEDEEFGYKDQEGFVKLLRTGLDGYEKLESVMRSIVIDKAEVVLGGDCDIVLILFAADTSTLGSFVTTVLRRFKGVEKTNTATLINFPDSPQERSC